MTDTNNAFPNLTIEIAEPSPDVSQEDLDTFGCFPRMVEKVQELPPCIYDHSEVSVNNTYNIENTPNN